MAYSKNSNPNVQHSRMDNGTYKYYTRRNTDGTSVSGRRKASLPKPSASKDKMMVTPLAKPIKKANMVTPISKPLKTTVKAIPKAHKASGTVNRKNARTGLSKTASAVYRKVGK